MNTCIAEGCPKDIAVKKHSLCRSHYNKLYYYGELPKEVGTHACKSCGGPVPQPAATGPRKSYCTKACQVEVRRTRQREYAREQREAARAARGPRACDWCTKPLPQDAPGMRRFHPDCAKAWTKATHRADNHNRQCTHDGCDRPTRARGMCSMHYKQWARAEGLVKPEPWDDRRKNNHHLRRARMIGNGPYELVTIDALMARDHNTCNVCDEHIDPTLEYPNPMSKSIDHIIAVSRGGEHTMNNTAPSHLICNVRKNDKPLEEARAQHG